MDNSIYLLITEVELLNKFNNFKNIIAVHNYLWINTVEKDNYFSITDVVELTFENDNHLFFKVNEDDTGLTLLDAFDYQANKKEIEKNFAGQVKYVKVDAQEEIWKQAITNNFIHITAQKEESRFLNNQFIVSFEGNKLELTYNQTNGIVCLEWED